jgi:hypothetical protein
VHNYCAALSAKERKYKKMRENGRRGDGVARDEREGG